MKSGERIKLADITHTVFEDCLNFFEPYISRRHDAFTVHKLITISLVLYCEFMILKKPTKLQVINRKINIKKGIEGSGSESKLIHSLNRKLLGEGNFSPLNDPKGNMAVNPSSC